MNHLTPMSELARRLAKDRFKAHDLSIAACEIAPDAKTKSMPLDDESKLARELERELYKPK